MDQHMTIQIFPSDYKPRKKSKKNPWSITTRKDSFTRQYLSEHNQIDGDVWWDRNRHIWKWRVHVNGFLEEESIEPFSEILAKRACWKAMISASIKRKYGCIS
jgi:hypothetical protein